jgi:N-formylglutamate deformylase
MWLSEGTMWPYRLRRGRGPLVVSMPHVGTFVPHSIGSALADCAVRRPDTDWHLPRLYSFVAAMDATVITATHSRYVVDLNRPPDGANLYPGRDTPRLCPVDTFASEPLYRGAVEPGEAEIARRVEAVWRPYHRRLRAELERVRDEHGIAMLWDAHSIAPEVPRLFEGRLPHLNLGTANGASCDPQLGGKLLAALRRHGDFESVLDGRFTGGYITRTYGRPAEHIHAVQLEMTTDCYMDLEPPYAYRPDLAARIQPVLQEQLAILLEWARVNRAAA